MESIVGVLVILLGIWQMYATVKYFKDIKKNGNKSTSPFALVAIWSSFVISIIFIFIGISLVFNWI